MSSEGSERGMTILVVDGNVPVVPTGLPVKLRRQNHSTPEVPKLLVLRVGPEIVDFWGRSGHLPPQNPSAQVGGFAI
jgi:hypothetical protein